MDEMYEDGEVMLLSLLSVAHSITPYFSCCSHYSCFKYIFIRQRDWQSLEREHKQRTNTSRVFSFCSEITQMFTCDVLNSETAAQEESAKWLSSVCYAQTSTL